MPDSLQTITNDAFYSLKHPLQRRRFALFFALILFPLIGAALVAGTVVLIVPLFAFLLWMGSRVLYARFLGNCILVSDLNYPRIHGIGEDLKTLIGFKKPVNIFVYEQGNFNAFLLKFFFYRRAVFLNSELLEAGVSDDELRWLIGRFIGYLRARRQAGFWGWTIRAAQQLVVFNLFLLPYERALVYSGDRIALAVINGDISTAVSAMQKLMVGRLLGYSVNPSGLVDQHRLVKGSFFAFLARIGMSFPHMTARYVDLIDFGKERYPAQFARFEAENPGLPPDMAQLAALPNARPSNGRDPVFASLTAAVVVIALAGLVTWKVVVPRVQASRAAAAEAAQASVPFIDETTPATTTTTDQQPQTTTATTAGTGLEPYTSTDGRFTVSFPGTPTESSQQVNLQGGESMTLNLVVLTNNGVTYMALYNDYPSQYVSGDAQTFLEGRRDGAVQGAKGTLATDEAIDLNRVPGRAYTFTDASGNSYTAHDFLNGQRFYQLIAVVPSGGSSAQVDDFMNSFHIQ